MLRKTTAELGDRTTDGGRIYRSVRDEIRSISFGDYLKRYIYINSGITGSFREIPLETYRRTLIDAFRERGVPASMHDRSIRLSTVSRRWLTQDRVGREAVMLMGFGLAMLPGEVNQLLTEALHDHRLDPEDPLEAMCEYCYAHHYGWEKLQQLRTVYEAGPEELEERVRSMQPEDRADSFRIIRQDLALLTGLMQVTGETAMKRRTRECFRELYEAAGKQLQTELSGNSQRTVRAADLEQALCPMVQRDAYGNLKLTVRPEVRAELSTKRFTRLHQHLLLNGKKEPERYDLLTLGFYLHTGPGMKEAPAKERIEHFRREMNRILSECGFGSIYEADPYDTLLLLALSSTEPLEAYHTVIEMACEGQGSDA